MPTDPTPQHREPAVDIAVAFVAVLVMVSLAVLAPEKLTAVSVTIIAACQLRRLL